MIGPDARIVGIVAHDPGGAELVSSYIRRHGLTCAYALDGPANDIFARKLGRFENRDPAELVNSCDWMLCGTSKYSNLEWRAIGMARSVGKSAIAMLDHWVGYRERFVRDGVFHLPDEVWVGDEMAAELAEQQLPEVRRKLVPNIYLEDSLREIDQYGPASRDENDGIQMLYLCEPLRPNAKAVCGYDEEEAVRYFLSHAQCLSGDIGRIVLRPHPKEDPAKYDWALNESDLPLVIDVTKTLVEHIAESDVVAGCTSMAMVVALQAGKRVISCIPPFGTIDRLPHPKIEDMQALLANQKGRVNTR